jgi:NhaP-type Na+/H+ and K+/H+ antiporter
VFFAVLVSTLLQGATVAPLARRLRLGGALAADDVAARYEHAERLETHRAHRD